MRQEFRKILNTPLDFKLKSRKTRNYNNDDITKYFSNIVVEKKDDTLVDIPTIGSVSDNKTITAELQNINGNDTERYNFYYIDENGNKIGDTKPLYTT